MFLFFWRWVESIYLILIFALLNEPFALKIVPLAPKKMLYSKNKPSFWGVLHLFGYEAKTVIVRIFVIFQHRPMLSHIDGKLSPRPFE